MRGFGIIFALWVTPAVADGVATLETTAQAAFDRMPTVHEVAQISGVCGADETVDPRVVYCTTQNRIYLAADVRGAPETLYLVAHAYGHAVQVRHGVADVALAQIRARPTDEVALRRMVELQVDCIAGFLISRAGLPDMQLDRYFRSDPLNAPHWGRNPLRIGPVVGVDLADRAAWFDVGQAGDVAACAPGEFASDLLVEALIR